MTTDTKHSQMVSALKKPGEIISEEINGPQADLLHMVVGISGESGELLDAVKKHVIYQKDLDRENLIWRPDIQEEKTSQYGGKNIRYKWRLKKQLINEFKQLHNSIIPWNTIRYIF